MGIVAGNVRSLLRTAETQLKDLNLGNGGSRHQNIGNGIAAALRYLDEQEATLGRLLETATLRDGIAIQRAIEDAGVEGAIRQLHASEGERPATYRVEIAGMATIEGTVEQLVTLLGLMQRAG